MKAASLTGGGHNAFSRYERGEAAPPPAVVNLFRLLDRHPKLLDELGTDHSRPASDTGAAREGRGRSAKKAVLRSA